MNKRIPSKRQIKSTPNSKTSILHAEYDTFTVTDKVTNLYDKLMI